MTDHRAAELYDLADVRAGRFMGLDLPLASIYERRRALGRRLTIVPVRYRNPTISFEEARKRADVELRERQRSRPGLTFGNVEQHTDHPMMYVFATYANEWQREGRIPGGLLCAVDKVDGHIWTDEEYEQYAELNAEP